jgi:pimeloyl-ACP methyl ester carboxylesterase
LGVPVEQLIVGVRAFYDRPDLTDVARTWPGRLSVISGEHDRASAPTTSAAVAVEAVHGTFGMVGDSGHYVNLEQPATFDRLLADICTAAGHTSIHR